MLYNVPFYCSTVQIPLISSADLSRTVRSCLICIPLPSCAFRFVCYGLILSPRFVIDNRCVASELLMTIAVVCRLMTKPVALCDVTRAIQYACTTTFVFSLNFNTKRFFSCLLFSCYLVHAFR